MRKYELLKCGDSILRVLDVQQNKVLVLDCIKKTMPVWVEANALLNYSSYQVEVAFNVDDLSADQRKVMYQRYTMIAPVLPFIAENIAVFLLPLLLIFLKIITEFRPEAIRNIPGDVRSASGGTEIYTHITVMPFFIPFGECLFILIPDSFVVGTDHHHRIHIIGKNGFHLLLAEKEWQSQQNPKQYHANQ
jgi:hypothetical protein